MEQQSLFNATGGKGSSEWNAFNTIRHDKVSPGVFRVHTPIKQQPRYTNVVHIKRYNKPQYLFPKTAL